MNTAKLGDLVKIQTGKLDANASVSDGDYPFFTCSKEALRIDNYSYECECVLVAGNGDLNVKYYDGKFDAYQRTYIMESDDKNILDVKYLYYFMETYIHKLREQSIGGVIKYIKLGNLTDAKIPLPDLKTQKKIVAVLDKAQMLIVKRKAAISRLDELLQSVFLDMFGDPVSNERKWERELFGTCLLKIESGWSPRCETFPASKGEWGVLKLSAVTKGVYIPGENKELLKDLEPKQDIVVNKGDLLFIRKNTLDLVGTSAFVFDTPDFLMMPDTIFRFVLADDRRLNKIFLWQLFNNIRFKKEVQKLAGGSAGSMPNISKQKLKNIGLIIPDIDLQNQYANFVMKQEKQKEIMKKSLRELEDNFQSLLYRGFKGKL
ncbi:restriction endonuclease subunit S [Bacillus cereus]|nr:restriction endonuclease subunit S [Bacillus cereus]